MNPPFPASHPARQHKISHGSALLSRSQSCTIKPKKADEMALSSVLFPACFPLRPKVGTRSRAAPADHDTVATSRKAIAKEQTMRHANSPPHLPVSPLFVVIPQRSPSLRGSLSLQALCPHTYKYTLQQVINFLLCKYSYMIYSFPSYRFQF